MGMVKESPKPQQIHSIKLAGKIIGNIWLDKVGYFYRPGRGRTGDHDATRDGEHYMSVASVMASLNDGIDEPDGLSLIVR